MTDDVLLEPIVSVAGGGAANSLIGSDRIEVVFNDEVAIGANMEANEAVTSRLDARSIIVLSNRPKS